MVDDDNKMEELWGPVINAWFPNVQDNTDMCLIKVRPEKAHYWDGTENKGISFF
jgi:general stress protein 26